MKYKKITLPNGLRIIHIPTKGNPSVTVMALVETGSNYESKEENGLSHFFEHMVFKGTSNRPKPSDITRELDGLGTQSNAFTGNEMTAYYAKAEKKRFKKLLEIVADIYLNSTLPSTELEKERGVILQEISMNEDEPQRKVWNVFSELLYGDSPAGRSILGPAKNIKNFKKEDFEAYRAKHYTAKKTIVVVAGDVKESDLVKEVTKQFKGIKEDKRVGKERVSSLQTSPKIKVFNKKTDQMHLMLGFKTKPKNEKERASLDLLAGVLGKGFSSRLFERLREKMGVCYYVRASSSEHTDHGYFAISTGVDPKRVEEVVKALLEECKKLTQEMVTLEELSKVKDYLVGNMYLGLETTDSLVEFYADQEITRGKLSEPKYFEESLRKVTGKDLMKTARELFKTEKINLAVVGSVKDPSRLKKLLVL